MQFFCQQAYRPIHCTTKTVDTEFERQVKTWNAIVRCHTISCNYLSDYTAVQTRNNNLERFQLSRQFVYRHFVYDTSSTDISSTDITSTTVYQGTGQLYIQLLFQQIIIFINSNFYLHFDSFLSIPLPLTL